MGDSIMVITTLQFRKRSEFWDKCNDEDYVQSVVAKRNFDYDIQHMESITGHQHSIYAGAIWHDRHTKADYKTATLIRKLICKWAKSTSYHCSAMIATTRDGDAVIVESKFLEHNHELDPEGTDTIWI